MSFLLLSISSCLLSLVPLSTAKGQIPLTVFLHCFHDSLPGEHGVDTGVFPHSFVFYPQSRYRISNILFSFCLQYIISDVGVLHDIGSLHFNHVQNIGLFSLVFAP